MDLTHHHNKYTETRLLFSLITTGIGALIAPIPVCALDNVPCVTAQGQTPTEEGLRREVDPVYIRVAQTLVSAYYAQWGKSPKNLDSFTILKQLVTHYQEHASGSGEEPPVSAPMLQQSMSSLPEARILRSSLSLYEGLAPSRFTLCARAFGCHGLTRDELFVAAAEYGLRERPFLSQSEIVMIIALFTHWAQIQGSLKECHEIRSRIDFEERLGELVSSFDEMAEKQKWLESRFVGVTESASLSTYLNDIAQMARECAILEKRFTAVWDFVVASSLYAAVYIGVYR